MSTPQQFSLKWNNYSQHIVTAFQDLRGEDDFTDVTLSCDGKRIKAHKVLLSACSPYFKETFRENPCKHPVIILKNVDFSDLQAVVTFMYNGQVNISQERLSTFLQTAELLQIKGLTEMNDSADTSTTKKRSHTSASEPVITNVSQKSAADVSIASEIANTQAARPPTPKRKRIGPASFMQKQQEQQQNQSQSDSQVPITTQAGSSFHSNVVGGGIRQTSNVIDTNSDTLNTHAVAGPSGVSSSTGGFINPETVIIPSSSMIDPSATHLSSSNESYSHGIIKFEEEDLIDEDDDYDKTNMSEDNDNSIQDMLGSMEHDQNSMGSYMAGPSGQGIKIVSVGSDSTSHDWSPVVSSDFKMTLTRGGNPKLLHDGRSYMLNSKNRSGTENWRCLRTKICHGRLCKTPYEFRMLASHSDKCLSGTRQD